MFLSREINYSGNQMDTPTTTHVPLETFPLVDDPSLVDIDKKIRLVGGILYTHWSCLETVHWGRFLYFARFFLLLLNLFNVLYIAFGFLYYRLDVIWCFQVAFIVFLVFANIYVFVLGCSTRCWPKYVLKFYSLFILNVIYLAFVIVPISCIIILGMDHKFKDYFYWSISAVFVFIGASTLRLFIHISYFRKRRELDEKNSDWNFCCSAGFMFPVGCS